MTYGLVHIIIPCVTASSCFAQLAPFTALAQFLHGVPGCYKILQHTSTTTICRLKRSEGVI